MWLYLKQMLQGLRVLHIRDILHRDIKSANMFLSEDGKTIKLGDLNVSKVLKDDLAKTQTGTPYYVSPEIWDNKPYGAKTDIWSLGCVVYEIVALKPPFLAKNFTLLCKKVKTGKFAHIPLHYSERLQNVIREMLNP